MTSFPIVGVGASAGGLEAVSELLAGLPSSIGMAFIVVQHLDPDHESLLSEILAKRTRLGVTQAHQGMAVEPDHIYVIPPGATLTLDADRLRLTPRAVGPERFMPVDALFRSLADARGESAFGVVLSGADADGALGLQAIKHSGGITFAQEPAFARFPSMPRSAIETGCVDFVLRPDQIARELARLAQHPYLRSIAPPESATEKPPEATDARVGESLKRIFRWLRTAHGVDFTHYKRSTLQRRLARRMAFKRIDDPEEYVALMEGDPSEAATLYQDFLIRVTGFFRDPKSFDGLAQRVFPSLCEGRSPKEPIRIWVPGCASGEEVYSIAIAIVEYLGDRHSTAGIQIFGTDVSEAAIERARAGIYLDTIAQDVSEERLERFFVKQGDQYQIAKNIRDLCVFARQDVTRDPPFSRLDLVSCRNLLIYLDTTAQRRVMQVFHYALRPHGYLMLGPSESIGHASDLFELSDKSRRLYTRRIAPLGTASGLAQRRAFARPAEAAEAQTATLGEADSAQREADRLLLARFAPATLLVDEALNILQFRGETGPYLEHASGPPSLNLSRVVRPELLVEIDPAIREARESGVEARREGLCVGDLRDVSIEVIPLQRLSAERCYLILFEDGSRPASGGRVHQQGASALPESEKDRRLAQSEREIAGIRNYLQASMEDHEAVKEELKSAHDEVLSANEEFQSTNEELETAKEELQSANEELTTTNEELRNRNRELAVVNAEVEKARVTSERAREYADQIIETVREPMLVLDADLTIVRANKAYYTAFKVLPVETEGRRFYDVGNGQWDRALLREGLTGVLSRSEDVINRESTYDVPALGQRVMSVSARRISGDAEREELILLAIEDVTERNALMERLREAGRRKDEFLAMLAHELRNPLAPIMHAIHLLQSTDTAVPASKLHEMIERQTQNLVRLVDELLDVARITRGNIELRREPVDLVGVAREAAEAARPRAAKLQHALLLELPDAAVRVDGDPVRLEQVISNLLENAAKYTDPGGRITLALTQDQSEAVLRVRDTGIGLAPEMLENIFDLFTQVDSSLARPSGGLGLGLTLVRRVLALHGGRIEARSAGLGQGSEFIVRLPLLPRTASTAPAEAPAATKPAASGTRKQRVLIVDDNTDASYSLGLLARSWGHEVAVARTGPEALVLAKSFKPETGLVDIGLPGMDGYELARQLRKDPVHRNLQLVALTGYGRAEDRSAARAAGFDLHLIKPAKIDELKKLLASEPAGTQLG